MNPTTLPVMKGPSIAFLLFALLAGTALQAQPTNRPNYSLQLGGQFRFLNPVGLNYALTNFNTFHPEWMTQFEEIKWTGGASIAAGLHRDRSEIRFQVQTFGASTFAIGPDSLGDTYRRDVSLSGGTYQIGLSSQLIVINRNLNFGVGGTFSLNRMVLRTDQVLEASYSSDNQLPVSQTFFKPSINLVAPIRIGMGPFLSLNIEPTYQIFFGPTNFGPTSELINGSNLSANDPSLEAELDHFGLTISLIAFLRRRY